jgi:hypothetical protein
MKLSKGHWEKECVKNTAETTGQGSFVIDATGENEEA